MFFTPCYTQYGLIKQKFDTKNGKNIRLGGIVSNENEAKLKAVEILKQDYGIDYNVDEIKFEWGGRL